MDSTINSSLFGNLITRQRSMSFALPGRRAWPVFTTLRRSPSIYFARMALHAFGQSQAPMGRHSLGLL